MNKYIYPKVNEELYHEVMNNGLNVYLLQKKGFSKSFATFSTNLGSINTTIENELNERIELPLGIAHFLEHKLFEQNNEDVSSLFAKNQARVNAFTQNNRTTYLFSCTDNLTKNLDLLLNFVQFPSFTKEGVEKEKSIIAQEIKMYEDDPNTVAYMTLIRNVFKNHPIRNDILGTEESISKITVDVLNKVHNTFYSPKNMVLFVTGNFIPEALMEHIRINQANVEFKKGYSLVNNIPIQDNIPNKKSTELKLEIDIPNYILAIKQSPTNFDTENIMKKELIMSIFIDLLLGKSSHNYKHLINNELINDSFGIDITFEESYGYFIIGSETNFPNKLDKSLRDIFSNLASFEITKEDFLRTKRQIIGGFIQALNSLEYIANQFTKYHFLGASLFNILDIADTITVNDVLEARNLLSNEKSYSKVIVLPNKNGA
jgi:predicted Zn-dependent peptidase